MALLLVLVLSWTSLMCNGNIANKAWKTNAKESSREAVKVPWRFNWSWDSMYPQKKPTQDCGGTYETNSGIIDYPSERIFYENNAHCEWNITVKLSERIKIWFTLFDTEALSDIVTFSEGGRIEATFSGNRNFTPWVSETNQVSIKFKSDYLVFGRGFILNWKSFPSDCGGTFETNSGTIAYPSEGILYENYAHCEWNITVKLGERIKIWFTLFETEALHDTVTFSEEGRINATFSGHHNFTTWISETNQVSIKIESDYLVFGRGFILNWKSFPSDSFHSEQMCEIPEVKTRYPELCHGFPSGRRSATKGFSDSFLCQHIEVAKCELPEVKAHCLDLCHGFP